MYIWIVCGFSGKWHAAYRPLLDDSSVSNGLTDENRCLLGMDVCGKAVELSSLYAEILRKTLKSRSMVSVLYFCTVRCSVDLPSRLF